MKKKTKEIAIRLKGISKKYEIHHEKPTLIEKFVKGKTETFWALKNINLTIKKGEKVGIIGPNGAGKTTLLKIITGITTPTHGNITIHGRIVSLIDLGAGFHPELTGYQNIYLNSMLLGMNKKEIDSKLMKIIQFADIKQFIDIPLFTYSQGMVFRLAFSIGIHANPDILIIDENISTGDLEYQIKSLNIMKQLFTQGKTVLIVSHWHDYIKKHCERIIEMAGGNIQEDHDHLL